MVIYNYVIAHHEDVGGVEHLHSNLRTFTRVQQSDIRGSNDALLQAEAQCCSFYRQEALLAKQSLAVNTYRYTSLVVDAATQLTA